MAVARRTCAGCCRDVPIAFAASPFTTDDELAAALARGGGPRSRTARRAELVRRRRSIAQRRASFPLVRAAMRRGRARAPGDLDPRDEADRARGARHPGDRAALPFNAPELVVINGPMQYVGRLPCSARRSSARRCWRTRSASASSRSRTSTPGASSIPELRGTLLPGAVAARRGRTLRATPAGARAPGASCASCYARHAGAAERMARALLEGLRCMNFSVVIATQRPRRAARRGARVAAAQERRAGVRAHRRRQRLERRDPRGRRSARRRRYLFEPPNRTAARRAIAASPRATGAYRALRRRRRRRCRRTFVAAHARAHDASVFPLAVSGPIVNVPAPDDRPVPSCGELFGARSSARATSRAARRRSTPSAASTRVRPLRVGRHRARRRGCARSTCGARSRGTPISGTSSRRTPKRSRPRSARRSRRRAWPRASCARSPTPRAKLATGAYAVQPCCARKAARAARRAAALRRARDEPARAAARSRASRAPAARQRLRRRARTAARAAASSRAHSARPSRRHRRRARLRAAASPRCATPDTTSASRSRPQRATSSRRSALFARPRARAHPVAAHGSTTAVAARARREIAAARVRRRADRFARSPRHTGSPRGSRNASASSTGWAQAAQVALGSPPPYPRRSSRGARVRRRRPRTKPRCIFGLARRAGLQRSRRRRATRRGCGRSSLATRRAAQRGHRASSWAASGRRSGSIRRPARTIVAALAARGRAARGEPGRAKRRASARPRKRLRSSAATSRSGSAVIGGARPVVTADTGAAHVAGMLGVPVVDCFPERDAPAQIARWRPWAAPVYRARRGRPARRRGARRSSKRALDAL